MARRANIETVFRVDPDTVPIEESGGLEWSQPLYIYPVAIRTGVLLTLSCLCTTALTGATSHLSQTRTMILKVSTIEVKPGNAKQAANFHRLV